MGGGTGRQRIVIGAVALLGLLAAVGLASRAHTPAGGSGSGRALDTDILLEYALVVVAAAAVVILPVAIWMFVAGRKEEEESLLPARRNWMLSLFLTMTVLAVLAGFVLSGRLLHHHGLHPGRATLNPLASLAGRGARAKEAVRFDWMPVIVVGSLTAAGLAAALVALRRRREPPRPRRVSEQLVLALERTLEDLRAEPDPRRAVIAAYAQMERALADASLPRAPSEAPREYLQRVLPGVGAGAGSVERLTALFERAKFSPHAIDAAMKEEAIVALETLRDELRGAN
jgi:Domain of unknown function (DUF4129)